MGIAYERFAEVLRKARELRPRGTDSQNWIARKLSALRDAGDARIPRSVSRSLLARWEKPGGEGMPQPPIAPDFVNAIAEVYGANEADLYDAAVRAWLEHNDGGPVAVHFDRRQEALQAELDSVRAEYEAEHRDHELRSGLRPTERELIWTVRRVSERYPGATNAVLLLVRLLFPAASGDATGAYDHGADVLGSMVVAIRTGRAGELLALLAQMARTAHPAAVDLGDHMEHPRPLLPPGLLESAPRVGSLKRRTTDDELQAAVLDVLLSRPGDSEAHDRVAVALDELLDELRADPTRRIEQAHAIAARRPADGVDAFVWYLAHRIAHDEPHFRARLAAMLPKDHALLLEYRELRQILAGPAMELTEGMRGAVMAAREHAARERMRS